jgi:hypothetical protein
MRQWFLNFLVGLLRKILYMKILIASMKTLTNSTTCTVSRNKILFRFTISVISPRNHLLLDRRKVNLKIHIAWAVYGTIFRITASSGASFTVTGGFLDAATSVFKEARKTLHLIFLAIKTNKILKTTNTSQKNIYRVTQSLKKGAPINLFKIRDKSFKKK